MFALRIIRWVLGYVCFSIAGREPERFLNLAARDGLRLWDIRREDGVYVVCISRREYRRLRGAARKARVRPRVKNKIGLPFLLHQWKGKRGILYGAAAGTMILILLSMQVWIVDVQGNTTLDPHAVKEAAAEFGLKIGAWKRDIDPLVLQQKIMSRFPEISWISVNNSANKVTIDLREGVRRPDMEETSTFANVVAGRPGQVTRVEIYHGTPEIKVGDAVAGGQLLVNGVTEDVYGGNLLSHASAKIMARTRRDFSAEIPLEQTVKTPTGEVVIRRSLHVFGATLPLSLAGAPEDSYIRTLEENPLMLNGVELPLTLYTETFTMQTERPVTLTREQAKQQALEKIKKEQEQTLKNPLEDGRVISSTEEEVLESGTYVLRVHCVCEENIAVESQIFLES